MQYLGIGMKKYTQGMDFILNHSLQRNSLSLPVLLVEICLSSLDIGM